MDELEAVAKVFDGLSELVKLGHKQDALWNQISDNHEERRKMTETEGRSGERLQQTITQEQARLFGATVVRCVVEEVKDKGVIARIARRMQVECIGA